MNPFFNRQNRGLTMIELIITLVIALSLLTLSVLTLNRYMPRQRLISSTDTVEQALSQAQYEATSRVLWSCITYDTDLNQLQVWIDADSDHLDCGNTASAVPDYPVGLHILSNNVTFADCSDSGEPGDGNPFDGDNPVWFDTSGSPRQCTAGNCTVQNLEFIVVNDDLPATNRSREVEASSSGLIEVIPRGEIGYNTATWANTPTGATVDGCE